MEDRDELHPDKYFYVCDGTVIRNVEELFQELQDMPEDVFQHHVNEEKNDFHRWIKDVFGDYFLAKNIEDAEDKEEILRHVFVSLFR